MCVALGKRASTILNFSMKKDTTFSFILFAYGALLIVVAYFGIRFVADYLESKQSNSRSEFEFILKANPEDVIFSQAYKNEKGQNNIKYAYLTDEVQTVEGEDINRRTPDSQTFVLEQFTDENGRPMEKLKTVFTAGPQFYRDEDGWRQIEYATTTQEQFSKSGAVPYVKKREFVERVIQTVFGIKPVFAITSTFYPDPNTETSSVDGQITATSNGQPDSQTAWDNVRGATTGTASDDTSGFVVSTQGLYIVRADTYSATIRRGFLLFDTSSLGAGATISSATLSVYATIIVNTSNFGNDTLCVITTTPDSNTGLVGTDYDNVGSTLQATAIDITTITTGVYTNFTLNSTGLANVSKTSVTKFGLRIGEDINNSPPIDSSNQVTMSAAETTGTSEDPKLEVVYTVGSFSMGQWFPF